MSLDIFALSLDVRGKTWFLVILINVGDNNKIQIYTTVPEGEVSQKGEINACHIAAFWLKRLLYARSTSKEMQNIAFNWHCRAILILIWWHESAYRIIWWSPLHLEEKIKKKRWKRTHERKRKTSCWCPYVQISPTKKTTVFIFCDVFRVFQRGREKVCWNFHMNFTLVRTVRKVWRHLTDLYVIISTSIHSGCQRSIYSS